MDINTLLTLGIAPEDYHIALLIYEGKTGALKRYHYITPQTVEAALFRLTEKSLITFKGSLADNLAPNEERLRKFLFPIRHNAFFELFHLYPRVVNAKGKERILRVLGVETAGAQRLKAKYERIIKNDKRKHLIVMKCLEAEIWERKRANNLGFMVELERYIDEQLWEKYLPYIEKVLERKPDTEAFNAPLYGQEEF